MARRNTSNERFDHDDAHVHQGWTCKTCTFLNQYEPQYCQICYGSRMHNKHDKHDDTKDAELDDIFGWTCKTCTFFNQREPRYCQICYGSRMHNKHDKHDDTKDAELYSIFENYNHLENEPEISLKVADSSAEEMNNQCRKINVDQGNDNFEIRMVLIGRTGSGKSATGNTILGGKYFNSRASGSSITGRCTRKEVNRNGKTVLVLDTPGLFDTNMTKEQTWNEIAKCVTITCPGPHAFVLVVGIGRFTEEEHNTVDHFISHFGKDMIRYMLVIFTRRDDIDNDGTTIDDYVKTLPQYLISILEKCGYRYLAFNNGATGHAREDQVNKLVAMINRMVGENGGLCYTNEMYKITEANLQSVISETRKQRRLESIKEQKAIEDRIEKQYESVLKDMKGKINQLGLEKDDIENELKIQKQDAEDQMRTITCLKNEFEINREKLEYETERQKQAEIDKHEEEMAKQNNDIEKSQTEREKLTEKLNEANAENQKLEEEKFLFALEETKRIEEIAYHKSKETHIRSEIRDYVEKGVGLGETLLQSVTTVAAGFTAGAAIGGPVGAVLGALFTGLYVFMKITSKLYSDSD